MLDNTNPTARFLPRRAAATHLGVSVRLLDALIKAGKLPACRPSKRRVLLDVRDLDGFMCGCKA